MNKGINAIKNIIWVLSIMLALLALMIGIIFTMSHKYYGEPHDGILDIRASKNTVVNKKGEADAGIADNAPVGSVSELKSTQDAGVDYIFSLTYLCDSTITGLRDYSANYGGTGSAKMWTSDSGLSAAKAADTTITSPSDGSQIIPSNAAMVYQPKRLVIYLGADSLTGTTQEEFINGYKKLIEGIRKSSPNTSIAVCSIASIAASYTGSDGLSAEKIAQANGWIRTVCSDTGVYFADLASKLNGENGYMKIEFANADGRTLNSAGINEVMSYFRLHASL